MKERKKKKKIPKPTTFTWNLLHFKKITNEKKFRERKQQK